MAPAMPPAAAMGLSWTRRSRWPEISLRNPAAPPAYPGQMPTVLVMLAVSGIAQGQQERERDEAAATGHPVEHPGAHTPENQQDDMRRAQ